MVKIHQVVFINLDHRKDRLWDMRKLLLDDLQIPEHQVKRFAALVDDPPFRGCTRSHLAALRQAFRDPSVQVAAILEDDLELLVEPREFRQLLKQALHHLGEQWDVLYWGMTPIRIRPTKIMPRLCRVFQALAMPGYLVHRRYWPTMERIYQTALDTMQPHDLVTQRYQNEGLWYGFYPPVFRQRPGFSDIEQKPVDYSYLEVEGQMLRPV